MITHISNRRAKENRLLSTWKSMPLKGRYPTGTMSRKRDLSPRRNDLQQDVDNRQDRRLGRLRYNIPRDNDV